MLKQIAAVTSIVLFGIGTAAPAQSTRPNVLVIMADDLSPGALSCYGSTDIQTPHIDALAERGVRFRTAYATPVCGPSRILIMTGRYATLTGQYNMGDRPGSPKVEDPRYDFTQTEITFGNILRDAGYRTTFAGKWQLVTPLAEKVKAAGFDEQLVWRIGFREGFGGRERTSTGEGNAGSRYFHPSLTRNGRPIATKPSDFGPDMFVEFLGETITADSDQPWLAYYPMVLPHGPLGPTPDHPDLPYGGTPETFKAAVEYMDKMVGRLVAAIDDSGQRDNTLIIFTTDNGTDGEGKNTPSERGALVPFVISWPGVIPQGRVSDELTDLSDVLPTVVEAAGLPLPKDREISGRSLLPYLRGEAAEHRGWIFSCLGQFRILRTKRWLLEYESVDYRGDFYDCGDFRDDVSQYKNVTDSREPHVVEARAEFDRILKGLPPPDLPPSERMRFIEYLERYNGTRIDLKRTYPSEFIQGGGQ
jgi:arylsulfatase A-like enzyme